jgi:hypothetical protein
MAKKKKQEPIIECYYAKYYPDTGFVAGILNHADTGDLIEITKEVAINKALVREKDIVAKNSAAMFERIVEDADKQEVIVEWNQKNQQWIFTGPASTEPLIFIVKESNHDVLLRVIRPALGNEAVAVPFTTEYETDIKNVAVLTRKNLDSYGLRVVYE